MFLLHHLITHSLVVDENLDNTLNTSELFLKYMTVFFEIIMGKNTKTGKRLSIVPILKQINRFLSVNKISFKSVKEVLFSHYSVVSSRKTLSSVLYQVCSSPKSCLSTGKTTESLNTFTEVPVSCEM